MHLKRSLVNPAKRDITQLTALAKPRLRRMQYRRPGLLGGFLARTRLDLTPPVRSCQALRHYRKSGRSPRSA